METGPQRHSTPDGVERSGRISCGLAPTAIWVESLRDLGIPRSGATEVRRLLPSPVRRETGARFPNFSGNPPLTPPRRGTGTARREPAPYRPERVASLRDNQGCAATQPYHNPVGRTCRSVPFFSTRTSAALSGGRGVLRIRNASLHSTVIRAERQFGPTLSIARISTGGMFPAISRPPLRVGRGVFLIQSAAFLTWKTILQIKSVISLIWRMIFQVKSVASLTTKTVSQTKSVISLPKKSFP